MNQYRYKPRVYNFLLPLAGLVVTIAGPLLSRQRKPGPVMEEIQEELTETQAEKLADRAVVKAEEAEKVVAQMRRITQPRRAGIGRFIVPTIFVLAVRWLLTPPRGARRGFMIPQTGAQPEAPTLERQQPRSVPVATGLGPEMAQQQQREMETPIEEQPRPAIPETGAFDYPTARQETRETTAPRETPLGEPDDLKVIEGIGPAIARHLNNRGIRTFNDLAAADMSTLEDMLAQEGILQLSDPHTWPEQARLAANGQWDELERMKRELKAGKES